MSRAERRALVERTDPALPVSQQCRLLAVSRSSVYRQPTEVGEEDRTIMALIDRQYLARPYYGSRRVAAWLATQGHVVNRKRVRRLMRLMGLVAIYQRPNTSKAAAAHKIYPYLLGGIAIERVNQVWCSDVTYIPMAKGFLYLVVVMDWVSRVVLAWRLSNTLGADFCVEALEEALSRYGPPGIFNTDQGSQFTSDDFTGTLKDHGIMISMDGKGRCMDNIFVERLWRSLKYEEVYLNAYASVAEAKAGIGAWLDFYNEERQHQSLGYRTPRQIYDEGLWICGRSALPTGSASPASRASSQSGEMLTFAHIPTGATANKGFDIDEVKVESLTPPSRSPRSEPTPKSAGLHLKERLRLSHDRGPPQSGCSHRLGKLTRHIDHREALRQSDRVIRPDHVRSAEAGINGCPHPLARLCSASPDSGGRRLAHPRRKLLQLPEIG